MISQRSWPWKVKVIGQNKWHHQIPLAWKHVSRCQNHHPKCLTLKDMVKEFFFIMATNVTRYRTSHVQITQDVFWSIERPRPKLHCVKIWWQFVQQEPRYGPKCDLYSCDPWKVKIIREVNNILHCNSYTNREYICQVSLKSYCQLFRYGSLKVATRKRKKERKKNKRCL